MQVSVNIDTFRRKKYFLLPKRPWRHPKTGKYRIVWIIFLLLGLASVLPWNFFMTATAYFSSRLADPQPANVTAGEGESRNYLQAMLSNVMTLCAMIPLLVFTCLTSILHQRIPQRIRIVGSLFIILLVLLLTAILVKVPMQPLTYFVIIMIKTVISNVFGAILQGSLFGMAGVLPAGYITPIMSGQGIAGTLAALAMICALASGSPMTVTTVGYFMTACFIVSLTIVSYIVLSRMEFYQYYQKKSKNSPAQDEENETHLWETALGKADQGVSNSTAESVQQKSSIWTIFKKIWVMALAACLGFIVTVSVFPAVAVDVKSTIANGGTWEKYFIPVWGFLLYNVFDLTGRMVTAVVMWPASDSKLLPLLMLSRFIFVPLLMFCNVQPRHTLPVIFQHDACFIVFIILFALSNGYLASLCMCYGPKNVDANEAETAGAIMALFLSLGLALGAGLSFVFRGVI